MCTEIKDILPYCNINKLEWYSQSGRFKLGENRTIFNLMYSMIMEYRLLVVFCAFECKDHFKMTCQELVFGH